MFCGGGEGERKTTEQVGGEWRGDCRGDTGSVGEAGCQLVTGPSRAGRTGHSCRRKRLRQHREQGGPQPSQQQEQWGRMESDVSRSLP